MAWRVGDLGDCLGEWSAGKGDEERIRLFGGLFELADRPLTQCSVSEFGRWVSHPCTDGRESIQLTGQRV